MTEALCIAALLGLAWGFSRLLRDNVNGCDWNEEGRVRGAMKRPRWRIW